jgi:N-acyl-D-aspartate/D-glutamate deacylase
MMALCAVLKRHNAAYFTHIRDESNKVIEGVDEAIDIARTSGVHVEIRRRRSSTSSPRRERRGATSTATPILTLQARTR